MERNLKLLLAYDGTDFHGWQRQAGVRTVQQELEDVLRRVLRYEVNVLGASRTDAGVHAQGQVAAVRTVAPIPIENVARAVGARLPADVTVVHAEEAAPDFHPSRAARAKLYRYRIVTAPRPPAADPAGRFAWHVWYPLDLAMLRAAAARLVGRHDFAGFASQGTPRASTVRTVTRVEVRRHYEQMLIDVEGDGFLYNQVRNMVGTLVEIGRGHWPVERITDILTSGDRRRAGPTAPPQGLCLQWVRYESAPVSYGTS
jgi:tRNA pseudouridine38-40 synthase